MEWRRWARWCQAELRVDGWVSGWHVWGLVWKNSSRGSREAEESKTSQLEQSGWLAKIWRGGCPRDVLGWCLPEGFWEHSEPMSVFILMGSIIVAYFHRTRLSVECLIKLMYVIRFQCIKLAGNGIAKEFGLSCSGLAHCPPVSNHHSNYKADNQVSLEAAPVYPMIAKWCTW